MLTLTAPSARKQFVRAWQLRRLSVILARAIRDGRHQAAHRAWTIALRLADAGVSEAHFDAGYRAARELLTIPVPSNQ